MSERADSDPTSPTSPTLPNTSKVESPKLLQQPVSSKDKTGIDDAIYVLDAKQWNSQVCRLITTGD